MDLIPTASQTAGPYLHLGMTDTRSVACLAGPLVSGEPVHLTLRLLDGDGVPVPDGMIEIWQADAEGRYRHPEDAGVVQDSFRGFGRMATGEDGSCCFETIKPGRVPGAEGKWQAPHLNVGIFGRGLLKRLATRIYFSGDAGNESDPVLGLVAEDLRHTLMAHADPERAGWWSLDIYLCGEKETVFFDV